MAQSIVGQENVQPYKFSECSKKDYIDALRTGHGLCLLNKPNEVRDAVPHPHPCPCSCSLCAISWRQTIYQKSIEGLCLCPQKEISVWFGQTAGGNFMHMHDLCIPCSKAKVPLTFLSSHTHRSSCVAIVATKSSRRMRNAIAAHSRNAHWIHAVMASPASSSRRHNAPAVPAVTNVG